MRFYLGAHMPGWLGRLDVPLFVSRRRLAGRKRLPEAAAPWALDSGGFSEIAAFGEWRTSEADYMAEVARYADGIGRLDWAAPRDYMCEPEMVARTGLTVREHQLLGRAAVVLLIAVGAALAALVSPTLALASATAFAASEVADLAVFAPLERRGFVLAAVASNVVGAVVDSLVFLWIAFGSLEFLTGQVVGKLWITAAFVAAAALALPRLRRA